MFLEPIRRAVACLGTAHVTVSPGGHAPGGTRAWSINLDQGLALRDGWHLEAQMHYEVIRTDDGQEWRVTTRAYRYRLAHLGHDKVRMHWHPTGKSPYVLPHLHLPEMTATTGEKGHLPVSRLTFEDLVEWAIGLGVTPARTDWKSVLDASRALHLQHRTWSDQPPPPAPALDPSAGA